jgi:hypothetical protein
MDVDDSATDKEKTNGTTNEGIKPYYVSKIEDLQVGIVY